MAVFVMLVAGLAMATAGVLGLAGGLPLSPLASMLLCGVGAFTVAMMGLVVVVTKLYQRTSASVALVRTGRGGAKVVLDGGTFVIPVLHKVIPISLETMRLNVERRGPHALITRDNLRVDLSAEFYIKVQPMREDILQAARSLGTRSMDPTAVSELVQEKLVSALRTVAATKDLVELHSKRDEFAGAVQEIVQHELGANGLSLETVTISSLDQTDTKNLDEANVFDAQGLRKIAQITQQARVERNEIEREAQRRVVEKNVDTRKQVLSMEREQAECEAEQRMKVANINAARAREIEEFRLSQDEAVLRRDIEKKRAIETAEVQRQLVVEQAELEKRLTLLAKQKEQETAEIEKVKAVEVAAREKEQAVALKEADRAAAQATMFEADAQRETARQKVLGVQVTGEAQREAEKKSIAAKQQVEQDRIKEQTAADVFAYSKIKDAEADRDAANLQCEAKLRLAEADAQGSMKRADGARAERMVDVNVDRERVDVERLRVEVERQNLSNKQEFEAAALKFEIEKLRIDADRDVRIQTAESMSKLMNGAQVQLFGDPTTMASMMQAFVRASSVGLQADGLLRSLSPEARDMLGKFGVNLGQALAPPNGEKKPAPADVPEQLGGNAPQALAAQREPSCREASLAVANDGAAVKASR